MAGLVESTSPRSRVNELTAPGQPGNICAVYPMWEAIMLRALSLLAIGVCANALVGLSAAAQTTPEVTLTRLDCGNGTTPLDPARFNDTFGLADVKVTLTFSCYLVKHGN